MRFIALYWDTLFDEEGCPVNDLVFPALYYQMLRKYVDVHVTLLSLGNVTHKQLQLECSDLHFRDHVDRRVANNHKRIVPYVVLDLYREILAVNPISDQIHIGVSTPAKRIITMDKLVSYVAWIKTAK